MGYGGDPNYHLVAGVFIKSLHQKFRGFVCTVFMLNITVDNFRLRAKNRFAVSLKDELHNRI